MTGSHAGKKRVAILGATGCVGRTILAFLERRPDIDFLIASRHREGVEQLAQQSRATCVPLTADAGDAASLSALFEHRPDLLVNCSGQYRANGMTVARAAVQHAVNLIDIGDEPVYIEQVLQLDAEAKARKCRLLIGSGTAPQATGALVRLAIARSAPGVHVTVGACFGVNRVGPKAVRTATEAVGGRLSVSGSPPIWTQIRNVPFCAPFGARVLRNYALPETAYLPRMKGVDKWEAGVALPERWQDSTVAFLQRTGLAHWLARSRMGAVFAAVVAAIETWMAAHKMGHLGIALYVEARNGDHAVVGSLYHPDMTDLTAHALAVTVEQEFLEAPAEPKWGVQLAQDCVDPEPFLDRLRAGGATWDLKETGTRPRSAAKNA